MESKPIPQDIKDKIEEKANKDYPNWGIPKGCPEQKPSKTYTNFVYSGFVKGAEFGYSLASPKQDEQEQLWDEVLQRVFIEHEDLVWLQTQFTITRNPIADDNCHG